MYHQMRKKTDKMNTIFKPKTRDTRTNPESSLPTVLLTGTITTKMQNEPNLQTNSHKCPRNIDLRKYLHPAMLVSTNIVDPPQEESTINNQ
jgi:hypothetical protein